MSHGVEIISPGCEVWASLMLFSFISIEFVLLGSQSALFEGEITMKYLHFMFFLSDQMCNIHEVEIKPCTFNRYFIEATVHLTGKVSSLLASRQRANVLW